MPNWIYNKVRICGEDADLAAVRSMMDTPEDPFDFREAVPEPDFTGEHPEFAAAWRVDNWGTRRPAVYSLCDGMGWVSDSEVWFATAWDVPRGVIEALSAEFPDVLFWMSSVCGGFAYGYRYTETICKGGSVLLAEDVPVLRNFSMVAGLMGVDPETAAGWIDPIEAAEELRQ